MAIRTVITEGFGNTETGTGQFDGTIALVVTRGYAIGVAAAPRSETLTLDSKVTETLVLDGRITEALALDGKVTESLMLDTM